MNPEFHIKEVETPIRTMWTYYVQYSDRVENSNLIFATADDAIKYLSNFIDRNEIIINL